MDWFRFYHDVLEDPKVQRLDPVLFKAWVNLLCLASKQRDRGSLPSIEDIAFAIRVDESAAREIVEALSQHELIDDDDGDLRIHNWDGRQLVKPSDQPERVAARVKKHRETRRNALRNADVTPLEQNRYRSRADSEQSREDAEQKPPDKPASRVSYSDDFELFWSQYPKGHGAKRKAFERWKKLTDDERSQIMAILPAWHASERWQKGMVKDAAAFLTGEFWSNPPEPPQVSFVAKTKAESMERLITFTQSEMEKDEHRRNGAIVDTTGRVVESVTTRDPGRFRRSLGRGPGGS